MVIKRDLYLNKLINKKHNGLIKVITGIRRCGKSYLLFHLFKAHLVEEGIDGNHIIDFLKAAAWCIRGLQKEATVKCARYQSPFQSPWRNE